MKIRLMERIDRERIHDILIATVRFTEEEVGWAMAQVDEAIQLPDKKDYIVHVLEDDEHGTPVVHGYVCFGPTPKTLGVWDLYWIAVDPKRQGQGIGTMLLQFVETQVRSRRGRMLLIETSSKPSYRPTVRFYEHNGYREITRIKDFYRVKDDKLVFSKILSSDN